MKKSKWLLLGVTLFSTLFSTQSILADSQESGIINSTDNSSTVQISDSTDNSSNGTSKNLEPKVIEDDNAVKQVIHIQKIISSEQINNSGEQIEKQVGVNDAQFAVYDVTDILKKIDVSEKSSEEIEMEIQERAKKLSKDQLKQIAIGKTKNIDQKDGIFDFSIEVNANQKRAFYIVNDESPTNVSKSEDIVLMTPVTDKNGEFLSDVWVYPKSELSQPKVENKKIISTGVKKSFLENFWDYISNIFSKG
ncbi:pilin N-terminal domain-containing protein [Enterococcus faecium]|nr:pilin N-terminal domain-containing protein [Enterococcus faecium]